MRSLKKALAPLPIAAGLMLSACSHRAPTDVAGLSIGENVHLVSGGPAMTIERFVGKGHQEAYCTWFISGKRKHGRFSVAALTADDSEFTPTFDQVQPTPDSSASSAEFSNANCTQDQVTVSQVATKNGYRSGTTCN